MPGPQWYVVKIVGTKQPQRIGYYGVLAKNADQAEERVQADLDEHFPDDYLIDGEQTRLEANATEESKAVAYWLHGTTRVIERDLT